MNSYPTFWVLLKYLKNFTTEQLKRSKEKDKEQVDRNHLIKGHEDNLSLVNRKIDTLFSMRLNNEIEPEEFTQRKNALLKREKPILWIY